MPVMVLAGGVVAGPGFHISNEEILNEGGHKMDRYLSLLEDIGFHGSVLVARNGNILLHKAYGIADVTNGDLNTTKTMFSTGSVTKQFTATAIMKLEMAGKLSVDDLITKYFDPVPEDKQDITLHHLLTHSAGFEGMYGGDGEEISRDEMMKMLFDAPLLFSPGSRYEYSNGGYSMLAAVVELVSGLPYEQYLQEVLFRPLGMNSTGLHMVDFSEGGVARSHNAAIDYQSPADRPQNVWNLIGNGGILSTPSDMYRWYLALQDDQLLSAASKNKMFHPHIRENQGGPATYYGYGWVLQQSARRNSEIIWHNGGAMPHGWSCAVYNYVDDSTVYIIFSNKTMDGELPVDAIAMGLSGVLFDEGPDLPPRRIDVDESVLARLEGRYTVEGVGGYYVSVHDGSLQLMPVGQDAVMTIYPTEMAHYLPKYNGKSESMIRALSEGRYEDAANMFDLHPGDDGIDMVREWWNSFDSLGSFDRFDVHGTRMGGGAETSGTLYFNEGSVDIQLTWMRGKCLGIGEGGGLQKEFIPQSEHEFASYSLTRGTSLISFSSDGRELILDLGDGEIRAQRQN